jgi:chemotaxis protein CheX
LCTGEEVGTNDVFDAMGEVVNILGGDIKLFLDKGGRQVRLSTPSVFVTDGDFHEEFLSSSETVACTMNVGDQRLMIGVNISFGQ